MANNTKAAFQPDTDIHITYEDQQKINRFAFLNAKLENIKEELKAKQDDLKNLEDATDKIELQDVEENVPYMLSKVFLLQDGETTQVTLSEAKDRLINDITRLEETSGEVNELMSVLRTQLYAKFGNNINLEANEE